LAWLDRDTAPSYGVSGLDFGVIPSAGSGPAALMTLAGDELWLWHGQPDGTVSTPVKAASALGTTSASSYVAADLDGDGVPDLVLAATHGVVVLPGRADGTFAPAQVVSIADKGDDFAGVTVGDIDRDGHPDIVLRHDLGYPDFNLWVLRGLGGFAFAAPVKTAFKTAVNPLAAGRDVDGDGVPDVLVQLGREQHFALELLHEQSDGTLGTPVKLPTPSSTRTPVVTDLNHDGILDLVMGIHPLSPLSGVDGYGVLLGRGGGHFAPLAIHPDDVAFTFAVGDVDGDGIPDLVSVFSPDIDDYGLQALVRKGRGDGTFTAPHTPSFPIASVAIALADVNGDGKPDILAANRVFSVSVLPNRGDGSFISAQSAYDVDVSAAHRRVRVLAHALVGVVPRSLHFRGARLSWTAAGKRASVPLR
jgi:hypothetical protein